MRIGARIGAALALAALIADGAAQAKCDRPGWLIREAGPDAITLDWKVTKGSSCAEHVVGVGRLHNFRITQRAAHGVAGANDTIAWHGFAYQPNAGYLGADHFQVTTDRTVRWSAEPVRTTIDVNVSVVENY